jgi:predicted CopG family antitoxin
LEEFLSYFICVNTEMNATKTRHTITINEHTFQKLRGVGTFGESYSDLILRLVDSIKSEGSTER